MQNIDSIMLGNNTKAYFFEGSQYSRHDLASFRRDPDYPKPIAGNWPGLWENKVDAAVNWGSSNTVFFFKGSEYIGYDLETDRADDGYPKSIAGNWTGLWNSDIDAAVNWGNGKIYFFKDSEYIRYDLEADRADDGYPKLIAGNWPGLWEADIDTAVNWGNGKVYFFLGEEFISYDIAADRADSGYPRKTAGGWPPTGEPEQQSDDKSDTTAAQGNLSAGRQNMLDLINKWMPTSLSQPKVPLGETQDLLAVAGWTKATGVKNKQDKDEGKPPATSCGDVLRALLVLWKSNFVGAFMIRDLDSKGRAPGAKERGFYVEADGVEVPKPGDILVLRNGVGKGSAGTVGHVGILVEAGNTVWRTADGGGGALPDQTASMTDRTVRFENNIPILKSPTDNKEKQLDGWVDLDKLEQTG